MLPIEYLEHNLDACGSKTRKQTKISKIQAILSIERMWTAPNLMTFYLVYQSLLLGFLLQLGNVGDNHRNYQVQLKMKMFAIQTKQSWFFVTFSFHHDERAKENGADEKKHREHFDGGILQSVVRVPPQILKLKFPVDHHKHFEEGLGEVTKGVALRSKVDDVEGKGRGVR